MVKEILESLHLDKHTTLVTVLPDRPNIFLEQKKVNGKIHENLQGMVDEVNEKGENCPKSIIYARTVDHATQIWGTLMRLLKDEAWVDANKASHKLRVELYHGGTETDKQKSILRRFTCDKSLKVIVATIAFGMVVQVNDVQRIVNWGPSRTTLDYWQEVGCCGSVDPRLVSQEVVDSVKTLLSDRNACIRKAFLEQLFVEGMSRDQLETCSSSSPNCCSNCHNSKA